MSWKKALSVAMGMGCLFSVGWLVAAEPPTDRVVVMYFHRTQRCPTCLRMEALARQAIQEGFPKQIQAGQIAFYSIDFQDQQNVRLTKAYGITQPSLIVVKVANNKGVEFKNLHQIWSKVRDPEEFFRYVQTEVAGYLPSSAQRAPSQ